MTALVKANETAANFNKFDETLVGAKIKDQLINHNLE